MFELTGHSILRHVLTAFEAADAFVHVPVDENAHKMTLLLNASNVVSLRLFAQTPIKMRGARQSILLPQGSPQGVQGLLQYFNLVEGCLKLIQDREAAAGVKYGWILRTRVDTFWTGPPHTLVTYNPRRYTVPFGCEYGGLNDRFGMGDMVYSTVALRRLSLLNQLHKAGYRGLNSERAFQAQMTLNHVPVSRISLPFCVLSTRKYSWPLRPMGVQVVALSSRGFMNGAKCRPCTPAATSSRALELVRAVDPGWKGTGHGVELCNAQQEWEPGWEDIFDRTAGLEGAAVRKGLMGRGYGRCVAEMAELQARVEVYTGPTPELLCLLSQLGAPAVLGLENAQWPVFLGGLHKDSIVYSGGINKDVSWEKGVVEQCGGCTVHTFDATPFGAPWAREPATAILLPLGIEIHNLCLASHVGNASVRSIHWPNKPAGSFTVLPAIPKPYTLGKPVVVPTTTLAGAMAILGHEHIDVLKLFLEGMELRVIEAWSSLQQPPPVCQLLLAFATRWLGTEADILQALAVESLRRMGLELVTCARLPEGAASTKCVFLSPAKCKQGMFKHIMQS
eukprot:SM000002S05672  [mRNA]  locus=s2:1552679:1554513:+ [translate_table: standard]